MTTRMIYVIIAAVFLAGAGVCLGVIKFGPQYGMPLAISYIALVLCAAAAFALLVSACFKNPSRVLKRLVLPWWLILLTK